MAEDYYSDAGAVPGEPVEAPTEESTGDSKTALIPRSFFLGEPEPGKTFQVTIERVHDDQVEVSNASGATEESPSIQPEPEMPSGMASMME